MLLEHSFTVPVPLDQAWEVLLDIERTAPCMPGATLTSSEGDDFTGTVKVKLGPVTLLFKGKGRFVERDGTAHRVVLTASGADSRGGGTAAARVTAALHDAEGGGTRVEVTTDFDVTGKAAQFGRGLIGDVSAKLIGQFADCLAGKLATAPAVSASSAPAGSDGAVAVSGPMPPAPAGRTTSAPTALSEASVSVHPDGDVEPIDFFAVSGIGAVVRRAVPYVVTAAASFAVVLGIIWWIKRR